MSTPEARTVSAPGRKRIIQVAALAWFAVISVDFLMNAGLLGPFLDWEQAGFLPLTKMFQYIPLGYAAFLVWTILFLWLMLRLDVIGARSGALFGAKVGILMAAAGLLGEMSVYSFPKTMLLCFALDKALYCIVLGAVIGSGLAAERLRPVTRRVVVLFLISLIVSVAMQNLGLVPARTFNGGRIGIQWNPDK